MLSTLYFTVYSEDISSLLFQIGSELGVNSQTVIPQSSLIQIMDGIGNKNKDSLYYYGLLKLYGISVPQSITIAMESFLEAALLGHIEAMTAYGVLNLSHCSNIATNIKTSRLSTHPNECTHNAQIWLEKAVEYGDMNAHWVLGRY